MEAKNIGEQKGGNQSKGKDGAVVTPYPDISFQRSTSDTAKAALVIAIISALLTAALYFNSRGQINNVADNVGQLDKQVSAKVADLEQRMDKFADLPEQVRKQALLDAVQEMSIRAEFLGKNIQDKAQREKLQQIEGLLKEMGQGLGK